MFASVTFPEFIFHSFYPTAVGHYCFHLFFVILIPVGSQKIIYTNLYSQKLPYVYLLLMSVWDLHYL